MAIQAVGLTLSVVSGSGWETITNALVSNNQYATATINSSSGYSIYFNHNGYNAIPTGRVHVGTVITVEARVNSLAGGPYFGAVFSVQAPYTNYTSTSDTVYTFGSMSDKLSFDTQSSNFGIRFSSGATQVTHYVDHVTVTLYHDDPPSDLLLPFALEDF